VLLLLLLQASQVLFQNDAHHGRGSLFQTDPQIIAERVARRVLSRNPPRHYIDGWLSGALYVMGCFMPCCVNNLAQAFRLRLPPLFCRLSVEQR
jgi:hypothetical protein